MRQNSTLQIIILFGGRSVEHEISIRSAETIWENLPAKYAKEAVYISKNGAWHKLGASCPAWKSAQMAKAPALNLRLGAVPFSWDNNTVVFPVLHGSFGEDGAVQGFLEAAGLPYVGAGVFASAAAMNKEAAKRLARQAGIAVLDHVFLAEGKGEGKGVRSSFVTCYNPATQGSEGGNTARGRGRKLRPPFSSHQQVTNEDLTPFPRLPLFVKPANLGSSVGITKVKRLKDLDKAVQLAFKYDHSILIEKGLDRPREIEVAVLGDFHDPASLIVSPPGEVIPKHEFYSYEAKYIDPDGAQLVIPAKLAPEIAKKARETAKKIFIILQNESMCRVDLLLDRKTGRLYFNEANSIPGFTSISMYPKMMEAAGLAYPKLLDCLIGLALQRSKRQKAKTFSYAGR